MKIMIIDDSTAMRTIVRKTLPRRRIRGPRIFGFDNVKKADLAAIKASRPGLDPRLEHAEHERASS